MQQNWRRILFTRLLLLLAGCAVIGLISGQFAATLALALAAYLFWTLRQVLRLHTWLREQNGEEEPPQSHGLWGEIFDSIYKLQRRNARRRDRLQAVIERMQCSTEALNDAVIMLDSQGNLEWWNPAAETLLGLKSAQDTGQPITNLIRHPGFMSYFNREDYREVLELPSPVNERIRLQFQITLYGNREHLMSVRDVTRVHQLEQMRKDFVANVSHELRTPLTVIAGYLETLLDNSGELSPRWARALQQMQQQSVRMQNLLNDLLLLARLETTEQLADNQAVALEPMLHAIQRDALALSNQQHQITLKIDTPSQIKGNATELHSAFSNLIFNAVRYTPAKSLIDIHWWVDDDGGHLAVHDNGPGIDSQHLPRLTERFYRADASRSSSTGGTGLGLAIVKHVLLRHHGKLSITSHPGEGSRFTCHFPSSQLQHSAPPAIARQSK